MEIKRSIPAPMAVSIPRFWAWILRTAGGLWILNSNVCAPKNKVQKKAPQIAEPSVFKKFQEIIFSLIFPF